MREQRLERRVVTALFVDVVGSTTLTRRHLLSLINDILDLSKVEAGRWNWSWGGSIYLPPWTMP